MQGIQRNNQTAYDTSRHGWTATRTNTGLVCLLFNQAFCLSNLEAHQPAINFGYHTTQRVITEVAFLRPKILHARETPRFNLPGRLRAGGGGGTVIFFKRSSVLALLSDLTAFFLTLFRV